MKSKTKNLICYILSFAFLFILDSSPSLAFADGTNTFVEGFRTATLMPGEEQILLGRNCIENNDCSATCDVDGTKSNVKYSVLAGKSDTQFKMFMKEKDKTISEQAFTGTGDLEFDSRKYDDVSFGIKNEAQEPDTFQSFLRTSDAGSTPPFVCNGALRILAPIAALLSGLLFLF